jgi:outer membrane protein OmpA-like peptidoglycan-associated protein
MKYRAKFRSAMVAIAAGAGAVLFATATPVYAQMQVLGAAPSVQNPDSQVVSSTRLILHDVRIRGNSVDRRSEAVLDYAAKLLRQYPDALIYVSGNGNNATVQRQARAVTRYLEQRGVAANRLVLVGSAAAPQAIQPGIAEHGVGVIVLSLATPNCGNCS